MAPDSIEQLIDDISGKGGRLFLSTSCDGNSSGASVFYARENDNLIFFTFNPTRKAEQIRANPRVQAVLWPQDQKGIKGLQIEGWCEQIKNSAELIKAREGILNVTSAFATYMDDPFLTKYNVTGYYRIRPTTIKVIDFHSDPQFRWKSWPENSPTPVATAIGDVKRRILLWVRALRAPFFTATLVPVLIGAAMASIEVRDNSGLDWYLFWLVLVGALTAHGGANLANDYGDHVTGNDQINQTPSPFNGGSRVIQAGLLSSWKVLFASAVCFTTCIACGLYINSVIGGTWYAPTPLLWIGIIGFCLGIFYTLGPHQLSYNGLGELAIALGFGPVIVLGTHYVLTANNGTPWQWVEPLIASLPVALFVMLIVWINQFQDAPADYESGKNNLVVKLSRHASGFNYRRPFRYYLVIITFAFILILGLGLLPIFSSYGTFWAFIAMAPSILLVTVVTRSNRWLTRSEQLDVDWSQHPYELLPVNITTIGIHLASGLLLALAWWLHGIG